MKLNSICVIINSVVGVCVAPHVLSAQEDSIAHRRLEGVEITAAKKRSSTKESAPLHLLDKAGIERLGVDDLADAIKLFSGAAVQDYGGVGGLKTVSVRSLGSKHTAVGYDGVTITNAQSGQVDISRFSLDNVDDISLSIGQTDDIFQTARISASAGAVNISMRKPDFSERNTRLDAKIKTGSFGMFNPSLRFEQKISQNYAVSLLGDWTRADGRYPYTYKNGDETVHAKRANSDVSAGHAEMNLFSDWDKGGNLQLKGYWFDSDRGLPGSIILYNDYHTERLRDKNMFAQAKYHNRFNEKFSLQAIGKFDYSWSKYQDFHSRHENGVQTDVYTQREYYISAVGVYKPMDYLSFSLAEDFFVNTLDATIPKCPFPERYTTLTNLSVQYSDPRLTLTASLLSTYAKEKVEIGESADDKKRLSPAASVSYRLFDNNTLRVRASYKDGFRLPTFNDLYYDRFGDKNLKPEKASQYNLGLTWSGASDKLSLEYASITADGYFNRVKDKIVAIPTMFIWKMMNMGTVNIGGVDLSISSRFRITQVINMGVDGNYSYQHAVDKSDKSSKSFNNQIPYTPRNTGNISLSIENHFANLSWTINMVGERYSLAENIKSNLIERYAEQQISANRSFSVGKVLLRLQAEVLNLTNKQYEVIKYYPMPGRSFRASVRMTY